MEQLNLFNETDVETISIEESANCLGVSSATIHNWVKTNYLKRAGKGKITLKSLQRFQSDISGSEKLVQRANKSLKDSHDHNALVSCFLDRLATTGAHPGAVGVEYESSLSDSYRNREGVYYTPEEIVRDLFTLPPDADIHNATFCDPCCGSGNFIARAIELGFKPENIYGYDIDPVAVEVTRSRIRQATGYSSNNIQVADFLALATRNEPPRFDCIYTNPPWGKKLPKAQKDMIGLQLGASSSVDTCALFFFACLRSLNAKGRLGLLLPEAFFNIATFEDARIKALQYAIERLIDYGKIFKGLVTKAQAITLRKEAATPHAEVLCEMNGARYKRSIKSLSCNPKSILNLYCNEEDAGTLQHLVSMPYVTLKGKARWGLGIVTGNNKKFLKPSAERDHIPVYKGADISSQGLKEAANYIPKNMALYQQVAPIQIYEAKEKLIYKFISSQLCFFYDDKQRYVLNSANMLIPDASFPVPAKVLAELLNSDFMNWVFSSIFNTHKILRGDLESLPVHSQFLKGAGAFNEADYLEKLSIEKVENGAYRIKR